MKPTDLSPTCAVIDDRGAGSIVLNFTWIVFEGDSWFVRRLHFPERHDRPSSEELKRTKETGERVRAELRTLPPDSQREVVEELLLEMSTVVGGPYATLADVVTCPYLLDEQCVYVLRAAQQKVIPPRLDISLVPARREPGRPVAAILSGARPITCHDVVRRAATQLPTDAEGMSWRPPESD